MVWLINFIIPGAGLILLRREWLGFCLALVFAICANFTAAGILIAPLAWPKWLVTLAGILTASAWLLAQVLCRLASTPGRTA